MGPVSKAEIGDAISGHIANEMAATTNDWWAAYGTCLTIVSAKLGILKRKHTGYDFNSYVAKLQALNDKKEQERKKKTEEEKAREIFQQMIGDLAAIIEKIKEEHPEIIFFSHSNDGRI